MIYTQNNLFLGEAPKLEQPERIKILEDCQTLQATMPKNEVRRVHYIFKIDQYHPCLAGHFPGNPIVPGVLILDRITDWLCKKNIVIQGIDHLKFIVPVKPETWIHVEYEIEKHRIEAFVSNQLILTGCFK